MEAEWDGDVELHEGKYWSIGLCPGVGSSGGAGLVWMWMVLTVWVVMRVLAVLLAMVVATMVEILVEVGCVGVVFESSGGDFVVGVLEDFGVVLWCGWRMALWCWDNRGDFLRRFSLMLVTGNMYVVAGAFLFGMVI